MYINALRGDGVNPELLGMSKVVSQDTVGAARIFETERGIRHDLVHTSLHNMSTRRSSANLGPER